MARPRWPHWAASVHGGSPSSSGVTLTALPQPACEERAAERSSPATTPEAGTRPRQDAPRDSLFASSHLGPMRTSLTPPKQLTMTAHSEQAPGSKKPFFLCSHSFLSNSVRLGAGAAALPLRVALRLSLMLRWVPVCPGWAGQGTAQSSPWQRARRACHLC